MDPRVAWIQPEQKGPANALWMRVWETSQVNRINTGQHHHNICVNSPALDVCNSPPSSSHQSNANVKNQGSAAHPLHGNAGKQGAEMAGSDSTSSCTKIRTASSNAIGNMNKGGAHQPFSESLLNNVNHHYHHPPHPHLRHPEQQNCGKRHPCHPPVSLHHHHHHPGRRKTDNKASTYGINYLLSNWTNGNYVSSGTPWKKREYTSGVDG